MARQTKSDLLQEIESMQKILDLQAARILELQNQVTAKDLEIYNLKQKLHDLQSIQEQKQPKNKPKKGRPYSITSDVVERVLNLRDEGLSMRAISVELGLALGTVSNICHGKHV